MANIRRSFALLAFLLLAASCDTGTDTDVNTDADADGDGFTVENGECDDTDPAINPGATEVVQDCPGCLQVDEDCDGSTDDYDMDVDGWTFEEGDCNDYDHAVNPCALEVCDEIDNDCDGGANDGSQPWYYDHDKDGYGDPRLERESCTQPDGYVLDGTDCDDMNADINPGEEEVTYDGVDPPPAVDENCDGIAE